MPWGKWARTPMQDVDAQYFHWLWTQPGNRDKKNCPVIDYIRRHLEHLKKEHPDGIWS